MRKTAVSVLVLMALLLAGAYFYFNTKFSPDENYLHVKNESGPVKIIWQDQNKNALLLPVHFKEDSTTYYVQFDTGSPSTIFYKNAVKNIPQLKINGSLGAAVFNIGATEIKSEQFKIIDLGRDFKDDSLKIIGTLGSDILENRRTVINFKENVVQLNVKNIPSDFKEKTFDFSFKKRKIIIPAVLNNKDEKYLYDSGSSAFELLTTQENWTALKTPSSEITVEKGNSWENTLTTYSAESNQSIEFGSLKIPLHQVTYVEGFSRTQYYLMKFSGMSGMLGNRIFLKHAIFIDGIHLKMGIQ